MFREAASKPPSNPPPKPPPKALDASEASKASSASSASLAVASRPRVASASAAARAETYHRTAATDSVARARADRARAAAGARSSLATAERTVERPETSLLGARVVAGDARVDRARAPRHRGRPRRTDPSLARPRRARGRTRTVFASASPREAPRRGAPRREPPRGPSRDGSPRGKRRRKRRRKGRRSLRRRRPRRDVRRGSSRARRRIPRRARWIPRAIRTPLSRARGPRITPPLRRRRRRRRIVRRLGRAPRRPRRRRRVRRLRSFARAGARDRASRVRVFERSRGVASRPKPAGGAGSDGAPRRGCSLRRRPSTRGGEGGDVGGDADAREGARFVVRDVRLSAFHPRVRPRPARARGRVLRRRFARLRFGRG